MQPALKWELAYTRFGPALSLFSQFVYPGFDLTEDEQKECGFHDYFVALQRGNHHLETEVIGVLQGAIAGQGHSSIRGFQLVQSDSGATHANNSCSLSTRNGGSCSRSASDTSRQSLTPDIGAARS